MSFGAFALIAVLLIPVSAAVILAFIANYSVSARINVLASMATFLSAALLFVDRPPTTSYQIGRAHV